MGSRIAWDRVASPGAAGRVGDRVGSLGFCSCLLCLLTPWLLCVFVLSCVVYLLPGFLCVFWRIVYSPIFLFALVLFDNSLGFCPRLFIPRIVCLCLRCVCFPASGEAILGIQRYFSSRFSLFMVRAAARRFQVHSDTYEQLHSTRAVAQQSKHKSNDSRTVRPA